MTLLRPLLWVSVALTLGSCSEATEKPIAPPEGVLNPLEGLTLVRETRLILATQIDRLIMGPDTWGFTRSVEHEGLVEVVSEGSGTYTIYCDLPDLCESVWTRTSSERKSIWPATISLNLPEGVVRIDDQVYVVSP